MSRTDVERLHDAREHLRTAELRRAAVSENRLAAGSDAFHAFVHDLIVIGTALGKVSDEVRRLSATLPWRDVIDTRNRVVHAYWQVDRSLLEVVTADRLHALGQELDGLIASLARKRP